MPLDILAKERRRMVLRRLDDARDPSSGLSVPGDFYDGTAPRAEQIALHHVDLPKLADAGAINWDRHDGVVYPGPEFEGFAELLRRISTAPNRHK
ncbi:hypothetical protein [Haloarcula marina]|uniref:hypothetical protein n=1 Tax=Haloarcula marina TaxID=2961574 RepID=UPI0020B7C738|nr:hypothetical protein [Halomicroarcula marina]